ncbi:MAG: hypothetical protein ABSG49_08800 [Methanoregula sp.]|jgi:hypothetical protein|uniref:hypothetical protein n=1 Tax=Methanoregula sp. TaxID=2052170 RepID=UPI003C1E1BF6
MKQPLAIQLKLYSQLREEIMQAINTQHRTFIAESFFVSIVFSFSLISNLIIRSNNTDNYDILTSISMAFLFITAPVVIFYTSLWLIEQSRMMRAGDFLELLEDEINRNLQGPYLTWENWLRRDDVSFLDVHKLHHYAQYAILSILIGIGYISVILIFFIYGPKHDISYYIKIITSLCTSLYLVLLTGLSGIFIKSICHRSDPSTKQDDKEKYQQFKKKYWEKVNY